MKNKKIDENFYKQIGNIIRDLKIDVENKIKEERLSKWQKSVNISSRMNTKDTFALQVAYSFVAKKVFSEICLKTGITDSVDYFYPYLQNELFNWYIPSDYIIEKLDSCLNEYNLSFKNEDIFGGMYQNSLTRTEKKEIGQFYTSYDIVDIILDLVGYKGINIIGKDILDPACGTGAFLIKASQRLINQLQIANVNSKDIINKVADSIYGFDINPISGYLCQINILLTLLNFILEVKKEEPNYILPKLNIYNVNSLDYLPNLKQQLTLFNDNKEEIKQSFDFIVGNPPFKKNGEVTQVQKEVYSDSIYGHVNLYGLFIHLGTELLKANGRIGYITPQSFLSGLYFYKLRDYILDNLNIDNVIRFTSRNEIFEEVLQGVLIFTATKEKTNPTTIVNVYETETPEEFHKNNYTKTTIKSKDAILQVGNQKIFYFSASKESYTILNKMYSSGTLLSDTGYISRTGQIVDFRFTDYIYKEYKEGLLPLFGDSGVKLYSFKHEPLKRGSWVRIGKKTENLINKGKSILVRRFSTIEEDRRIVASIPYEFCDSEDGYFVENHLNIIKKEKDTEIEPEYILALLNSKLYDFIFRQLNGNTQVSSTELNILPIKILEKEEQKNIIRLVIEAFNSKETNKAKYKQILEEIDLIIYRIYDLTDTEIKLIEDYYSKEEKKAV